MKVTVNMETCQHMGQCTYEAPEVFRLDDQGKLMYEADVDDALASEVELASRLCPTQSISFE